MTTTNKDILPPNAARIAQEVGGAIEELYNEVGLSCYREEVQVGKDVMVREGYLQIQDAGQGHKMYIKKMTRLLTRKEAEEHE